MKSNMLLVTLMFSGGKTVVFNTIPRYIPKLKATIEESGKHDRHKLTYIIDFMPKEAIDGPDIFVCMYDVVLLSTSTMADVQKMRQVAQKGKILVPNVVQKPQTIKLER